MSFYPGQIGENNSSIIFADWSYFLCSIFLDLQQCLPNNSSLFWRYLYEQITILFGMYVDCCDGRMWSANLPPQPTNQTHINTNLSILVRMNYGTLIKTHLKNDLLLNAFLCFENHHVAPMENICEYCVNIGSRAICGLFLWCCATLVFPVFLVMTSSENSDCHFIARIRQTMIQAKYKRHSHPTTHISKNST